MSFFIVSVFILRIKEGYQRGFDRGFGHYTIVTETSVVLTNREFHLDTGVLCPDISTHDKEFIISSLSSMMMHLVVT